MGMTQSLLALLLARLSVVSEVGATDWLAAHIRDPAIQPSSAESLTPYSAHLGITPKHF